MATQSRNLRTGRSIWERSRAPALAIASLKPSTNTDVLVVGAGITGAMLADALSAAGLKVIILDKRGPAKGSTTASTALVQYEIDVPLTRLMRKIGKANAVRAWRRSRLALDGIAARLGELGVRHVQQRQSLYLAGDMLGAHDLEREFDARRAAGLYGHFLDRKALRSRFGIARPAALLSTGNITIDPRLTTFALLKASLARGARICAPTEIVQTEPSRLGVVARTADGNRIRCRHLVFATGYELPDGVPRRGHKVISTFAIATVRQPRRLWPERCTIWEASEPYLYLRTTPDGRVICGGEDEDFSQSAARDALIPRKTATLQRKLARLFPDIDTGVDFAWAGTFGETSTGLPTIGEVPGMPNCWVALGYGGNGITYARIAADIIRGAFIGNPDVDADLYDFPRPPA